MKVAIHQPNFIPWIGYFHKISLVDIFVFLDDVQIERGKTFTQRAKILIEGNEKWITIPVIDKSDLTLIKDAQIDPSFIWKRKMLKTIELNYKSSPDFECVFDIIQKAFMTSSKFLIDYNIPLIIEFSKYLGLNTKFILSSELGEPAHKTGKEKILEINKSLKADVYVSGTGQGSMRYIEEEDYLKNGIELQWQKFTFKEYPQMKTKTFIGGLSIIDLVFNCAKDSITVIKL
jgi:hypothetical protein